MRRGPKPKHPQAVVLCATEELSDEVFHMAKFISSYAQLKSTKENGSPQKNLSNVPIGMIVGTPGEVLQHIEEGIVVLDEIKYLVLDEVDAMFGFGLGPDIQKIITPLRYHSSKSDDQGIQTILVTSTIAKILGKGLSPFLERLEHDQAGQIAAMLLEVDKTEAYHLTESLDALKKKVAEAIISLNPTGSES
ncbi:DEAD-box ATP-dependent RNA helicase 39-like isoform X2 [Juglans microcarpa x Juglans regia]|nr:DEAD-box ATP-dependent RNA helicase 39-like isoform X2 [Juglans microcarpa x Juglans regia]